MNEFDSLTSEERQKLMPAINARDVAAAIARGWDEYGRPLPGVFPDRMIPLGNAAPSTEDAGLRTKFEPPTLSTAALAPVAGAHGREMFANFRPSTNIEDQRRPYAAPSILMKRDWLANALDEATGPDPEADTEISQELSRRRSK